MQATIHNEFLTLTVDTHGAEAVSLKNAAGQEMLGLIEVRLLNHTPQCVESFHQMLSEVDAILDALKAGTLPLAALQQCARRVLALAAHCQQARQNTKA